MPVLPIPMIISLLLFTLLAQRLLTRETHITLLGLIAACATQSAVTAIVHYYDVNVLRPIQPILATCIPPIAWLAFAEAADHETARKHLWLHMSGPLLALLLYIIQPFALDVLIPLSFLGYGLVMLFRLFSGEASLPNSRLESGPMPVLAWRIIALSLIASAACDVFIAYSLAAGAPGPLFWVPSLVSSLSLLSLGILSMSHAMESRRDADQGETAASPEEVERDLAIVTRLDAYVEQQKPYLDPDLTLARLARKLVIPAKQISTAVNRVKQENLSRYINRHRIEDACRKLEAGESVTAAMLDSGFNTKSNFNREFLRVTGATPRTWKGKAKTALIPFPRNELNEGGVKLIP